MTHITEHHTEEEWEGNDGDEGWVSFQVCGDTVGIDDALEDKGKFVNFKVCWSWDRVVIVGADLASCVILESLLNLIFLFDWSPVVTNVLLVLGFHAIKSLIKSFFLGKEHLVDVNSGRSLVDAVSIDFVKFQKDLSKRLLGLDIDGSGSVDSVLDFFDFGWNLPDFGKINSLSLWLESIANSLDSFSDVVAVPENDDEYRSLTLLELVILSVVGVFLNVHVRFTLGGSENEFSKSGNFLLFDDTSDVLDVD